MLITIVGDDIQNVHAHANPIAFNVMITTRERGIYWDSVELGKDYVKFYFPENNTVTLTAEQPAEISVLHRLRFELHEKDQLWILFLDHCVYA